MHKLIYYLFKNKYTKKACENTKEKDNYQRLNDI